MFFLKFHFSGQTVLEINISSTDWMNPEGLRLIRVECTGEEGGGIGGECRELGWLGVIQKVWEPRGVNWNGKKVAPGEKLFIYFY